MALLAVPTVALVLLGALGVLTQAGAYRAARTTESSVQLVLAEQSFVHELQRERGLSNGLLAGQVAFRTQLDSQRQRVDGARRDLERILGGADPAAVAAVHEALGRLTGLGDQRARVDSGAAGRAQSLAFYTDAITALTAATARGPQDESDALLTADLDALNALGAAKEATALERGFLNGVFSAGRFEGQDYATFSEIRGNRLAGFTAFRTRATAVQQASLDAALNSGPATTARALEQRAIDAPTAEALDVDPGAWWTSMSRLVDDLRGVQQQVGADAAARAAGLRTDSVTALVLYVVLAIGAVIAAAGLSVIAARSITRPLRRLADDARDAATVRLPQAVARIQGGDDPSPADSWRAATAVALESRDDEIAEVARALTDVQRTAVELAGEQAVLRHNAAESMASLARRNQNLLRRQLGFITQLEREEEDADALAHLFELDHLATRMRRNAESLLVLIGESSPRRWSEPVPVGDVIRAALSEVEDYQRVTARRLDDAMIAGAAGTELAHLLAELLENALSFSPPDREVEVYGQLTDDPTYVIAIVDHGIGMPVEEMAGANARLSGSETFLVAPTRYLGHYVIGRLAHPLGIRVSLQESPLTGVTARVVLPATLLAERGPAVAELVASAPSPVPLPRPARAGREETPAAVAVLDPPDASPTPDGAPTHTRNGLVKRVRPRPAAPPQAPVTADPVTAVPEEAARRSRASVNAFRAGFSGRTGDGSPGGHAQ
jgi:signal transduction histidine kinase